MGQAFAYIPRVQSGSLLPKDGFRRPVMGCCLHSDPGFARATTHKFGDMGSCRAGMDLTLALTVLPPGPSVETQA